MIDTVNYPRPHGRPRDVLDYIAWHEHVAYVHGLCDSLDTAMAVFGSFKMSPSAARGRMIA